MIELIFVIVILGILAAVAIPKLAATRNDAKVAAEMTSVAQAISNLGAGFTSQGNFNTYDVTAANGAVKCFTFTLTSATDGNFTVQPLGSAPADGSCPGAVLTAVTAKAIANDINGSYSFGGIGIVE